MLHNKLILLIIITISIIHCTSNNSATTIINRHLNNTNNSLLNRRRFQSELKNKLKIPNKPNDSLPKAVDGVELTDPTPQIQSTFTTWDINGHPIVTTKAVVPSESALITWDQLGRPVTITKDKAAVTHTSTIDNTLDPTLTSTSKKADKGLMTSSTPKTTIPLGSPMGSEWSQTRSKFSRKLPIPSDTRGSLYTISNQAKEASTDDGSATDSSSAIALSVSNTAIFAIYFIMRWMVLD
ncbi:hypothetical protein K502DRAFT_364523 [Neoconidiobolus thromboides FSU 785]|nr:hypothetical protein K502DRAFT_364523 [Neoconidiobolus thromboides FSU 785]